MASNPDTNKVSEEIREPEHAVDQENSSDIEQASPEIYTETDFSEDIPEVHEGDPGAYTGEYEQVWKDADEELELRDDLPEGYVPGNYQGEYRPE